MDVLTSVRGYIEKSFPRKGLGQLADDAPLLESGIVDSMGILQLVGFLESEFSIVVDDEDILPENFETMTSIVNLVVTKVAEKSS